MSTFFKLFLFHAIFVLTIYFFSYALIQYQEFNKLDKNNQWCFNVSLIIEIVVFLFAAISYSTVKNIRILSRSLFIIFIVSFIIESSIRGFRKFASYSSIIESFCIIAVYLLILFHEFDRHPTNWYKQPVALFSITLLIYFICSVPYFSLMHYFQKHNPTLNQILFHLVINVMAHVRYCVLAFAFWLSRKTFQKIKTHS